MDKKTRLAKAFNLELPDRPPILGGWLAAPWEEITMEIAVFANKMEMGQAAAVKAAELLRGGIARKGHATFVVATGAS